MEISRAGIADTVRSVGEGLRTGLDQAREIGRDLVDRARDLFSTERNLDTYEAAPLNPTTERSVADFARAHTPAAGAGMHRFEIPELPVPGDPLRVPSPSSPPNLEAGKNVANSLVGDGQKREISVDELKEAYAAQVGQTRADEKFAQLTPDAWQKAMDYVNGAPDGAQQGERITKVIDALEDIKVPTAGEKAAESLIGDGPRRDLTVDELKSAYAAQVGQETADKAFAQYSPEDLQKMMDKINNAPDAEQQKERIARVLDGIFHGLIGIIQTPFQDLQQSHFNSPYWKR